VVEAEGAALAHQPVIAEEATGRVADDRVGAGAGPRAGRLVDQPVRVTEDGEQKVNVAIPLAIARVGKMKLASSGLVRGHLGKFGIDLDELLRTVDFPGKIVDIADNEDRVEIFVE